jgi:aminoglycoside phosphotransferase (APT) family kinase protein
MKPGAKIGAGRTAEIYEWNDRQIIKLFNEGFPIDLIHREAQLARAAHQAGVATPAVGDLVEIDGRTGLIYDRVSGLILIEHIQARPWRMRAFAREMAALHVALHQTTGAGVPSQRDRFRSRIQRHFDGEAQTRLLDYLDTLPDGNTLCHDDFHPENILLTAAGPVIIDWMNGAQGHPLADVARTSLILTIGDSPNTSPLRRLLIRALRQQFHQAYITHYCRLTGTALADIERWLPVIAAVRIAENIPGEATQLRTLIAPIIGHSL